MLGYGLAALTKPLFALAPTTAWIFAARFADRVGKGIRGAPRDALMADLTPPEIRGAAFGLRQTLDTIGAFAGPLLAIALMAHHRERVPHVFWFAVIPAFVSVALLVVFVREPERAAQARRQRPDRLARRCSGSSVARTGGSSSWPHCSRSRVSARRSSC